MHDRGSESAYPLRRVLLPVVSEQSHPEQADISMARTGFRLARDLVWVHGQRDGTYLAMKAAGPATSSVTPHWKWALPRQSAIGAMFARLWRYLALPLDV
jgi:hypothetical protein